MRLSAILLALLLLCGCQTAPPPPPPGAAVGPHAATIVFLRGKTPPTALGGLFPLDGVPRAKISVNEYVVVRCEPGHRELKFSFPLWVGVPSKKLAVDVAPSSTRYFVYSTDMHLSSGYPATVAVLTPSLMELPRAEAEALQASFSPVP